MYEKVFQIEILTEMDSQETGYLIHEIRKIFEETEKKLEALEQVKLIKRIEV